MRTWNYPSADPLGLQMTEEVSRKLKGRLPADAFGYRAYDSFRLKAGNATDTAQFQFFQTPVGQNVNVLNAAAESYRKSLQDTNLRTSGLLEQGQGFIVRSMQIQVTVPSQTDTTYPTSGVGTELATNPAAAAGVSGVNLANAILDQTYFVFRVSEKDYEEGPGYMFPTEYGISGFAGFGISTDFEGVANNGFGRAWRFPVERLITALTTFSVVGQFVQALTIPRNCVLRCILDGIKLRRVQ